jgi:hypothetical protein
VLRSPSNLLPVANQLARRNRQKNKTIWSSLAIAPWLKKYAASGKNKERTVEWDAHEFGSGYLAV